MESSEPVLRWIVLLPLLGSAVIGLLNRRLPRGLTGVLASATVGVSFVLAVKVFLGLASLPAEARFVSDTVFRWITVGRLTVDVGFAMDPLGFGADVAGFFALRSNRCWIINPGIPRKKAPQRTRI